MAELETRTNSHRQIIRSSAIVGSASIVTNILGIVRLKVAALLLGPVGIGLIGLYLNFVATASLVAGWGTNASAVREIALADEAERPPEVAATIRALLGMSLMFAGVAALAIWAFRRPIAALILSDPGQGHIIGWLALAIGLTVLAAVPTTLFNGFRKLGNLALVQMLGAILGTAAGIAALLAWGEDGILAYVLAGPIGMVIAAALLWRRAGVPRQPEPERGMVRQSASRMLRLGASFMLGTVALSLGTLAVRAHVAAELGPVALGLFGATWMISSIYLIVVLQALGTDFLPRITAALKDRDAGSALLNAQIEISVLLATPIILFAGAIAPWLLQLLYSEAFAGGANLLRWQMLGDLFKVVSYPLALTVLAAGRGSTYLIIEAAVVAIFVGFVLLASDRLGLESAGIGYLLMYIAYVLILAPTVRRQTGLQLSRTTLAAVTGSAVVTAAALWSAMTLGTTGLIIALGAAMLSALWTITRLQRLDALPVRLQTLLGAR